MFVWNSVRRWHCLAVALLLVPAAVSAGAAPLTFAQALALAAAQSAQLRAWDAGSRSAKEMAVAAGQLPDPVLKLGVNNVPVNGADRFSLTNDFMTMRSIGIMQEITRADKRKARAARFLRDADTAVASRQVALTKLQRETAVAWLDRFFLEQMRSILSAQRDETQLQVEASDAAYRGGRSPQSDVFAARSAVAQLDDRIAQADQQVDVARTRLARWVGSEATSPLASPPALDALEVTLTDLDARVENYPEIAVLQSQEAVAEADVQLVQANTQTDVSVEVVYSQRGAAYSNMLSVNLAIPLQRDTAHRQNRELAAKLAAVEQLQAEREEATRQYTSDAREMLQEWHSNRDRLNRFDTALLPLAAQRTAAALAAYRGATVPLSAVLEARRAEIDVRVARLQLDMASARLWAQLNYLIPSGSSAQTISKP